MPRPVCATIMLNTPPTPNEFSPRPTEGFLTKVLGAHPRLEALSRDKIMLPTGYANVAPTSLLAQTLHACFDLHVGVSLSPEVLWYAVLSQFAMDVTRNAEAYRDLFTGSPTTETIIVQHDGLRQGVPAGWDVAIASFEPKLRERVPSTVLQDALPTFTTSTQESNLATLVAFMDAASPYYRYEVHTRCGIPSIRLEGSPADWLQFGSAARKLALLSRTPTMKLYFQHLIPVIDEIVTTATKSGSVNTRFWSSIYKANEMSGGLAITGWFTAFFAYVNKGDIRVKNTSDFDWQTLKESWGHTFGPDSFTSHVSSVPFVWDYFGTRMDMRFHGGVLGVDEVDRHLAPRLGWAVAYTV